MQNRLSTHQTVRLARGKHSAPSNGVCVMELASMLSGERFTDRPYCVSPAIGGFLRAYNDFIDDRLRQDLYNLASAVVGTRSTPDVERARVRRVIDWGQAVRSSRPWSRLARYTHGFRARGEDFNPDEAGAFAVRAIGRNPRHAHARVLALVEELIACGQRGSAGSQRTVEQQPLTLPALEPWV